MDKKINIECLKNRKIQQRQDNSLVCQVNLGDLTM
jgi:hypothetical protein